MKKSVIIYLVVFLLLTSFVSCKKPQITNNPPTMSTIGGPSSGLVNHSYWFTVLATDPDSDSVSYQFDWDDGEISDWSVTVASGGKFMKAKSWQAVNTYYLKARVKDSKGNISDWSTHKMKIISDSILKWSYNIRGGYNSSSPAIGSDGTIYIASSYEHDSIYAFNPDGTVKWQYNANDDIISSLAIGADGTIYFGSNDHYFYAFNPDGTLKWRYKTEDWIRDSPAIGTDGTIYVSSSDGYIYALNPDGNRKWRFYVPDSNYYFSCPAVSSDGTIYIHSWSYLYALDINGNLKWRYGPICYGLGVQFFAPAIGADGTIYTGGESLYAINLSGNLRWAYPARVEATPSIGSDGTIYLASGSLHALNPDGTLKWRTDNITAGDVSPVISTDGTIYLGAPWGGVGCFYAFNSDGTLKWKYLTGSSIYSSPTIGPDSTIYFGCCDSNLYALRGSGQLANSPWPKFQHDLRNTGRVGGP